jgi:hypothetical protein
MTRSFRAPRVRLTDDRPTQRKHAYALLRSILREAEDEGTRSRASSS